VQVLEGHDPVQPGGAVTSRVRGALERADAALMRVRDSMTPGQRWTAALAMGLALAIVLFGAPR
jgi:hypothetical protein